MKAEELMRILEDSGAREEGHFVYRSGRHGSVYLQCARMLQYPEYTRQVVKGMLGDLRREGHGIDVVVGPATGGIILAYEAARQLECRGIFTERREGKMTLRRGFRVMEGEKVLVVEDVVTTGGSVQEVLDILEEKGADLFGVRYIVDRSGGAVELPVSSSSLISVDLESFPPERCPLCEQGIPIQKPGGVS